MSAEDDKLSELTAEVERQADAAAGAKWGSKGARYWSHRAGFIEGVLWAVNNLSVTQQLREHHDRLDVRNMPVSKWPRKIYGGTR